MKFYWNLYIEITFRHGCSLVNLQYIFRTHFCKKTYGRLLMLFIIAGSLLHFLRRCINLQPPSRVSGVCIWKLIEIILASVLRTYSRHLLGVTIAPNLVPWVLKELFSLEIVKNDICLASVRKQNALFSENVP